MLRIMLLATAGAGFIYLLLQVHDFPQTRQTFYAYDAGELPLWQVTFYFINEAGSGIRYALTGDSKHLAYFPRGGTSAVGEDYFHTLLFEANSGDWSAQVQLSHLLALGWGVEQNKPRAVEWYLRSEQTARAAGGHSQWLNSRRRKQVSYYLDEELQLQQLQDSLRPKQRDESSAHPELQPIGGERT